MALWTSRVIGKTPTCEQRRIIIWQCVRVTTQQKTLTADKVRAVMDKGGPSERSMDTSPKFQIGDRVKTLTPEKTAIVKNGHTRLPKYAADKNGVIIAYHGGHVLPDSNAHGLGENPEHLYAVQFKSCDIWQDADNRDYVVVDCWESYLK